MEERKRVICQFYFLKNSLPYTIIGEDYNSIFELLSQINIRFIDIDFIEEDKD